MILSLPDQKICADSESEKFVSLALSKIWVFWGWIWGWGEKSRLSKCQQMWLDMSFLRSFFADEHKTKYLS